MQLEINTTYRLLATTKDIWEVINKTYSKVGFISQVFHIRQQIVNAKQGTWCVIEYYNSLKGLFMKLDFYQNMEMEFAVDSKKMRDMLEMEQVF